MEKSIWTREYAALLRLLKRARLESGLTQVQLAKQLRLTQSLWSKMERGDCRIDVIQLRTVCRILGVDLSTFIRELEEELAHGDAGRPKNR